MTPVRSSERRPVAFGYTWVRLPRPLSVRVPLRTLLVVALLLVLTLAALMLSLMLGERFVPFADVLDALQGRARKIVELYVVTWRLPRGLSAIAVGALLGASGAIFQTLTRNPLGSPDVIGFTTGAYTGGLVVIILAGTSAFLPVSAGSMLGGLLTAGIVLALTRRGQAQGFRLIIMGIALTAMLTSLDTYMVLRTDLDTAFVAATWGIGSLSASIWSHVAPMLIAAVIALLLCVPLSRPLAQLDLGDELGASLGTRPGLTRTLAMLLGVVFVAISTTIAGPIAFVSLSAPQIARRLVRAQGTPMLPAAAVGALGMLLADLIAQHAFPTGVQVGVVTVSLGGLYLIYLVIRENRRGRL